MNTPKNPQIKQVRLRNGLQAIVWPIPPQACVPPFVLLGRITGQGDDPRYDCWQRNGAWREYGEEHPLDIITPITEPEFQEMSPQ